MPKYSKILVTGGSGTLGSNLNYPLKFSSKYADLRDFKDAARLVAAWNPDAIINPASAVPTDRRDWAVG